LPEVPWSTLEYPGGTLGNSRRQAILAHQVP
jgi:hypothetical protein